MGRALSKCCSTEPHSQSTMSTISSTGNRSRNEDIKLKRFKDKLDAIKENDDEYLGLQVIEDALLEFKVCQEDIHNYYVLEDDIGWGKFGIVKNAYSINSPNYEVAVKIINMKLIQKKYHYLAQEIVSLKRVDHPNIVKILEIYKTSDKIYIVMEKVKGKDLLDFLFGIHTLTEFQAATIVKQILKALSHLNWLNLWHRDIKLENIMIDPETLRIKLIDFGFSSFYNPSIALHTQVGTPYYIAPQILKGEYGKEWDMWSLGVVSFILLTGFPPFRSNNLSEIYRTIITNNIQYDERIWKCKSPESLEFVQHCLTYDPEKRMTPAEGLKHPWIAQTEKEDSIIDGKLFRKSKPTLIESWV